MSEEAAEVVQNETDDVVLFAEQVGSKVGQVYSQKSGATAIPAVISAIIAAITTVIQNCTAAGATEAQMLQRSKNPGILLKMMINRQLNLAKRDVPELNKQAAEDTLYEMLPQMTATDMKKMVALSKMMG